MVSPLDRPILVPMWCVSLQAERQLPFSNGDALSPSEFLRGPLLLFLFGWCFGVVFAVLLFFVVVFHITGSLKAAPILST